VYLGQSDSLVWADGVPVSDVPPPPEQTFSYACIYSDGSQELVSDPGYCPSKEGLDVVEVDDLTQVQSGTTPATPPPAIVINVPSFPPFDIPTLPTLPPPIMPVQFPAPPEATPPPAPADFSWLWLLLGLGSLIGSKVRRRRHVSS
jgi:hypothetical protein